jgi:hypothetical protein
MILLTLADRKRYEVRQLCEAISAELRLNRVVDESFIGPQLSQLVLKNFVSKDREHHVISELGSRALELLIEAGRNEILDQKASFINEFRQRVTSLSNDKLNLDILWTRLTDALCRLLMDSGMRVVREILGSTESLHEREATQTLLRDVALSALPFGVPLKRAMEVANAVFSLLTQQTNFRRWLTDVASTFVSLCSLGLHPASQREMLARMENWLVVIDTHLVLSFICEAEHDHESVRKVLAAWTRLNRRIATCDAVLEEVAYHAFAASRDFNNLWDTGEIRAAAEDSSVIKNAFIRAFLRKSQGQLGHTRWQRYIFNYLGKTKFDGSKLWKIVTSRGWDVCNTEDLTEDDLDDLLTYHPQKSKPSPSVISSNGRVEVRKRSEWDVRLVHACCNEADRLSAKGGSVMVMSRSSAVAEIIAKSGAEQRGVSISSVASLGYAMALTPGLSVSLPDVQELLLQEGLLKRAAKGLEKAARKVAERELKEGIDLIEAPMLNSEFLTSVARALRTTPI